MFTYNEKENRLIARFVGLGGLDYETASRSRREGDSPYVENVLLHFRKVEPGKVTASTEEFTLDEAIHYAFKYRGSTQYLILLGDTKCWRKNSGNPVEKTPSPAFTTQTNHEWEGFTMLHSASPVAVVSNGVDKPHYYDGGAGNFAVLSNAPVMKCIAPYLSRLFGGQAGGYLNRIEWSAEGDITTWSGDTWGQLDLPDEADGIMRLGWLRGNFLLVVREESVGVLNPTGDPEDPVAYQPRFSRGACSRNSFSRIENAYIYLGYEDVYICDGASLQNVGTPIRRELFSTADASKLQYAWSFVDKRDKDYYLVTTLDDGTQRAWIYNYEQGVWSQQDLTDYTFLARWYRD